MGDAEGGFQPSKKRAAGREITKDNPGLDDDDEVSEQEMGTFKRASDEVIAARRMVKVRRNQSSTVAPAPSSNPFAGIRLVPPTVPAAPAAEEPNIVKNVVETEEKALGGHEINVKIDENSNQPESNIEEPSPESTADKEKNGGGDGLNKLEPVDQIVENSAVEVEKIEKNSDKSEDATSKDGEADKIEKGEDIKQEDVEADKIMKGEDTKQEDVEASEVVKDPEAKKSENEIKIKDDNSNLDRSGDATPFSSFQQLSSNQNAFTGFAGTGFSSTQFSFGLIDKEGSSAGSGSLFESFTKNGGSSSLFGILGASSTVKSDRSGVPSMQEVSVETGEENEKPVFVADSVLFEYLDGSWKERGKGEVKVNVPITGTVRARLVMRTRGNYRLILNARLFPDMKLTNMEKKGITFACVNSLGDGKDGLSTFALKFKDPSIVDEFKACITEHKSKTPVAMKTPENSPKASSDE